MTTVLSHIAIIAFFFVLPGALFGYIAARTGKGDGKLGAAIRRHVKIDGKLGAAIGAFVGWAAGSIKLLQTLSSG